jgi:hypothetical protein
MNSEGLEARSDPNPLLDFFIYFKKKKKKTSTEGRGQRGFAQGHSAVKGSSET